MPLKAATKSYFVIESIQ